MTSPLFREAAVARQSERLDGALLLNKELPYRALTLWLTLCTLVALIWLATGSYQRKVTVSGTLEPDAGVLELVAPQAGVLAQLLVEPGQTVREGQPVFVVETAHQLENGMLAETAGQTALQQQEARLQHQSELEQLLQGTLEAAHAEHLHSLTVQQRQWEASVERQQHALVLRKTQLARAEQLAARGLLAKADRDTLLGQVLQQEQALADAEQQASLVAASIAGAGREHAAQQLRSRQQLDQWAAQLEQLRQQRLQQQAQFRRVVSAPASGRISALSLRQGTTVQAQQPILGVLPATAQLQAELHVPSQAIGFLKPGQRLQLRLDAFPYQKFGAQGATLAALAVSPELGSRGSPPFFRLVAEPDKQSVTAYGREVALRPGMAFTADISVDRRSLLEWLLEPLFSIRGS